MLIALINPQTDVREMRELYAHHENIGIALIAGQLRRSGHEVDLFDLRVHRLGEREMVDRLARRPYALIGLSVNYVTFPSAIRIAQLLSLSGAKRPFVALGGEHATYMDAEILKVYRSVDGVVRGEGERSFCDLADALQHGRALATVLGLTFRDESSGAAVRNANRPAELHLDQLAHAARDISSLAMATGVPIEIGILGQRGCPFPCSFCNAQRFLGNEQVSQRYRSAKDIVDEIEAIIPLFAGRKNLLRFYDATFVTKSAQSRKLIEEFCSEMEARGIATPFDAFIRANSFDFSSQEDRGLLLRLRRLGLISTYIGLEAGDDEQLDVYNKRVDASESERAFQFLKSVGMSGATNGCMVFHQGATFEQVRNSILFLQRIGLATFWNIASRAETLPGIDLSASMLTFPRRTVWDVANYEFQSASVRKLHEFIATCKDAYEFIRAEDNLCRAIRDRIRLKGFYEGSLGLSEDERTLDEELSSMQASTVEFLLGIMREIDSDAEWRQPADEGALHRYAGGMEDKLQSLSVSFGHLFPGERDPLAAAAA